MGKGELKMILKTKGRTINISEPIIATITRNQHLKAKNQALICEDYFLESSENFSVILTNLEVGSKYISHQFVHSIQSFNHLTEGDIVAIHSDGVINTLYRIDSNQNFLLATERCNSNCLMCSQPPRDMEDIYYLHNLHQKLIPLIPKDCIELGITGVNQLC